ncbi:uncharacterized protein LOC126747874 isoform X2 [Anthonomus grandis grandis]|uniref:uncharacterized protein LOC126747874 isoform X2 n=1 Tax=Anthonomus grandis grandis TaxID=2921223 RepID=UPI002166A9F3|nr:uncharacterized protein LOC126747874 isoform X2 [Anthonomus grandis grandis]
MEPSQQAKCCCEKQDTSQESDSSNSESLQNPKEKPSRISLFNLRRTRAFHFNSKRSKKTQGPSCSNAKKSPKWSIKFNCTGRKESKSSSPIRETERCCKCTSFKSLEETAGSMSKNEERTDDMVQSTSQHPPSEAPVLEEGDSLNASSLENSPETPQEPPQRPTIEIPRVQIEQAEGVRGIYSTAMGGNGTPSGVVISAPFTDSPWMRMIREDCEEAEWIARAREIEQGVEAPANFRSVRRVQLLCAESDSDNSLSQGPPRRLQLVCPPDLNVETLRALFQNHVQLRSCPLDSIAGCHTQVDFIHCLVPDLMDITNCSFYWGKMDRYEAERLLDGKPEGTFLLRDSAQEEFLFSVSFRKYGRSLHARIEQWNHRFSFDSHDPGVFTSETVCGLIEHYKDPSSCMFFEPMLTWPLHRNFTFSLQHLARAAIVNKLTYDNINHLQLPKTLKNYLKEYHYRQKVRVERFDDDVQWLEVRNIPP